MNGKLEVNLAMARLALRLGGHSFITIFHWNNELEGLMHCTVRSANWKNATAVHVQQMHRCIYYVLFSKLVLCRALRTKRRRVDNARIASLNSANWR